MQKSLIKSFLSFSIGGYISLIIGFFTVPITTRLINPEQYGIFSLFNLVINLGLLVFLLGFDQGFVRYFNEEENKYSLLYLSIKYPLLLFLACIPLIIIFRNKMSYFIYKENNFYMLIIFIISLFFSIINRFSFLIVRMNKRGLIYSFLQIFKQIFNFILIILIYKLYGNSYKVLILSYSFSLILVTILSVLFEKRIWINDNRENLNTNIRNLFNYGYPFILTMSLTWLFESADKLIIKLFSNLVELGLYAAAFKIIALINVIQSGFTMFWVPAAYEKYSQEPNNKVFFNQVFNYISFIMFLLAIIVLMSKNLMILLLGEKYYLASQIMPCLVFMPIMYTVSETTVLGINFSKKTKYHIIVSLITAIFNIIGNMVLVPKFGAIGAAISTGIAYFLFFYLRTYFAKKLIDYNFKLKRFYLFSFLIFSYSIYLSFYDDVIFILIFGIILIMILCILYFKEIKLIYFQLNKILLDLKLNIKKN